MKYWDGIENIDIYNRDGIENIDKYRGRPIFTCD